MLTRRITHFPTLFLAPDGVPVIVELASLGHTQQELGPPFFEIELQRDESVSPLPDLDSESVYDPFLQ